MLRIESGNILDDKYKVICHQVNTLGIMGAGLAKQIKEFIPDVYYQYKSSFNTYKGQLNCNYKLGDVQLVSYKDRIIYNIFGQDRISGPYPRTDYNALESGFIKIKFDLSQLGLYELAIPYGIGCGLAGGNWNEIIYPMIENIFENSDIDAVIVKYNCRES